MPSGRGTGFGSRKGMGFGFRGSSPPWPYVGLGRGGLPRCGYFLSGAAGAPVAWPYKQTTYPASPGFNTWQNLQQMNKEQELDFLKNQANAIRSQLEQIEARMRELETKGK